MIRLATTGDLAAIRHIAETAFTPFVVAIGRRPAPMDADFADFVTRENAIVGEEAGRVAGYLLWAGTQDAFQIDTVAVAPDAQGHGWGGRLMGWAETRAGASGAAAITLYTNAAMTGNPAWYNRRGYRIVDRRRERGFDRIYFRKDLASPSDFRVDGP